MTAGLQAAPSGKALRAIAPTRTAPRRGDRPPVLVINTYAGSLLVAASRLKLDIVGSYEDVGFGLAVQMRNFPELEGLFAGSLATWPSSPNLKDTVVVAHPPCAAFSNQNNSTSSKTRGATSDHFACTLRVMRYAFDGKAPALLVESVPGAADGGAGPRDALAEEYGYRVYHVFQNAATFGLTQWRPRYWAVFLRKDQPKELVLGHAPSVVTCGAFFAEVPPGSPDPQLEKYEGYQRRLLKERGLKPREIETLLTSPGRLPHKILRHLGTGSLQEIARRYCVDATCTDKANAGGLGWRKGSPFMSHTVYELPPEGLSPSILWDSWWTVGGVSVTPAQMKVAGGFPRGYLMDAKYRMWISKGVAPPVAEWILDGVLRHLERRAPAPGTQRGAGPGGTIDFRVTKGEWAKLLEPSASGFPPMPQYMKPLRRPRQGKIAY